MIKLNYSKNKLKEGKLINMYVIDSILITGFRKL